MTNLSEDDRKLIKDSESLLSLHTRQYGQLFLHYHRNVYAVLWCKYVNPTRTALTMLTSFPGATNPTDFNNAKLPVSTSAVRIRDIFFS